MRQHNEFWQVAKMEQRKQGYYAGLLTSRESGKEIRAMRTADFFRSRWRSLLENLTKMEIDLDMKNNSIHRAISLLELVFCILILGIGVWLLWIGKIQLGSLVMLWQLNVQLLNNIHSLASDYHYPMSYIPVLKEQKEVFDMVFDEKGLPKRGQMEVITKDPKTILG